MRRRPSRPPTRRWRPATCRAPPRSMPPSCRRTRRTSPRSPASPSATSRAATSRAPSRPSAWCRPTSATPAAVASVRAALDLAQAGRQGRRHRQARGQGGGRARQPPGAHRLRHGAGGRRQEGGSASTSCSRASGATASGTRRPRASSWCSCSTPGGRRTRPRSKAAAACPRSCSPEHRGAIRLAHHRRALSRTRGPAAAHSRFPLAPAPSCCRARRCRSTCSSRAICRCSRRDVDARACSPSCSPAPARRNRRRARSAPLRRVGCVGRVTAYQELDDGRLLITLTGIARCTLVERGGDRQALSHLHGRASSASSAISSPARGEDEVDRQGLLAALKTYLEARELRADWSAISKSSQRSAGQLAGHRQPLRSRGEAGAAGGPRPQGACRGAGRAGRDGAGGRGRRLGLHAAVSAESDAMADEPQARQAGRAASIRACSRSWCARAPRPRSSTTRRARS